jgi:ATP-dependent helicase/nuclease subunit A
LQESAGDIEPAAISEVNAVRLMTVHQSKGLEFPVVAVADLGKAFNTSDQNSQILLHEKYGVCGTIKPPGSATRYPSLPLWLAAREQRLSSVGEEMRVLYVALTRAENLLLLFGSTAENQIEKWSDEKLFPQQLVRTRSWLEWIGAHASARWPGCFEDDQGAQISVRVHRDVPKAEAEAAAVGTHITEVQRGELLQRLSFEYPYLQSTVEPAKTSVSAVRKRTVHADEEAATPKRFVNLASRFDGKNRGVAMHTFLQCIDLRGKLDESGLRAQAEDLVARALMKPDEVALIDWEGIAAFWTTDFGQEICRRTTEVRRELPFTFQLRNEDLTELGLEGALPVPPGEFIVTQGVADLVVFGEREIWLIDFKTDSVKPSEIVAKVAEYRAQVALYALALTRIYRKPVTRRGLFFIAAQRLEWME